MKKKKTAQEINIFLENIKEIFLHLFVNRSICYLEFQSNIFRFLVDKVTDLKTSDIYFYGIKLYS